MIKKNLNFLNNMSIWSKISLGLSFDVVVFMILSISFLHAFEKEKEVMLELSKVSAIAMSILDINRDVSELQRTTLVYGQTGSTSVLEKMKENSLKLQSELSKAHVKTNDYNAKKIISTMKDVIDRYSENIDSLEERYSFRKNLLENKLPLVIKNGTVFLKKQIEVAKGNRNNHALLQEILGHWLEANTNANIFINQRKYHLKKAALQNIKNIKTIVKKMTFPNNLNAINNLQFLQHLDGFEGTFEQAVQANRMYLSLVNVVMAGEASEFTTLSNKLRTTTLSRLDTLKAESTKRTTANVNRVIVTLALSLALLFLIALFYRINISNGIRNITETFGQMLDGNFASKIPGLTRGDEIGQLAKAADKFKDITFAMKEAKENALIASQAKSEFLANMSHELRTPLNAIIGFSSLIMEDAIENDQKRYESDSQKIYDSGNYLLTLINNILDIAKIESGNMFATYSIISLPTFFDQLTNNVKPLFKMNNNIFKIHIDESIDQFETDSPRLKQILLNLISNAAKFTTNGSIQVNVLPSIKKGRDYISFIISDTGFGIKSDKLNAIFDQFVQIHDTSKETLAGTGLGLPITKKLVELMGGTIEVKSKVGKGSNFIVELPKSPTTSKQKNISSFHNTDGSITSLLTQGNKVLIIDDDPGTCELISRYLMRNGYIANYHKTGDGAIELVRSFIPNLILLDIHLPGMNGFQILQELRDQEEFDDIPVVMISVDESKDEAVSLGSIDFLSKPFSAEALKPILNRFCRQGDTLTLLIIDNEKDSRDILKRQLENSGISIHEAENGEVALEDIKKLEPDLVILDLMMPEMDGFEFIKRLRSQEQYVMTPPVLVMTSKDLTQTERDRLSKTQAIANKGSLSKEQLLKLIAQQTTGRLSKKDHISSKVKRLS